MNRLEWSYPITWLDAALSYATTLGWPVLPTHGIVDGRCACGNPACASPGKHPLVAGGVHAATRDVAVIRQWAARCPNANLAVATGRVAGIVILDRDGERGRASLQAFEAAHGSLPATVQQITSRGEHKYFTYPSPDVDVLSRVAVLPGVDIRANGGYAVVAPSMHVSGVSYRWDAHRHPARHEIAACPPALLRLITAPTGASGTPKPPIPARIPAGQRNFTLVRIAGALRRLGLDGTLIATMLAVVNADRCDPPLEQAEVTAIARGMERYRPQQPQSSSRRRVIRVG